MRIQRLDHFGLEVSDLARAESFYTQTLGMEVVTRIGKEQVLLRCGDAVLALFHVPGKPPGGPQTLADRIHNPLGKGHHAFQVALADWNEARRRFQREGTPVHDPIDWGDHDCLYFLDPDGNLLELVCYRE